MTIIVTSDHAGFKLKTELTKWLGKNKALSLIDLGPQKYIARDDYPLYGHTGARAVLDTKGALGIFICGSGVGLTIVANRHKGIRAVCGESVATVKRARNEDDANVLVLGSRIVSFPQAKKLVSVFLATKSPRAQRHKRRIQMIDLKLR